MHEELSRLLAGELDAAAEAALRARIAVDPQLSAAWERMNALPDLLAGLPLEAPPPALMAKLRAMVPEDRPRRDPLDDLFAELAARPIPAPAGFDAADAAGLEADALDPAPYAPDPREDTFDPEPRAPRTLGRLARRAGIRGSTDRNAGSTADRRPHATADRRPHATADRRTHATADRSRADRAVLGDRAVAPDRRWRAALLGVGVAAALAIGLTGVAVPDEPPTLSVASGETLVEGDVHVRAGDLELRVDGRARITVTPPAERSLASAGADLVVVPSVRRAERARTPDREAPPVVSVGESVRVEAGGGPIAEGARTYAVRGGVAPAAQGSTIVTVRAERGEVVVRSSDGPVRLAAGETRTFDFGAPSLSPAAPPATTDAPPGVRPDGPRARVDEAVARTDLPFGVVTRPVSAVVVALESTPTEWPSQLEERWFPDRIEALLWDVETAVPSAALANLDCEEYPCVAVYAAVEADGAWLEDVRDAVRERFPRRVSFVELSPAADNGLVAVAVGPADLPPSTLRLDRRLHDALENVRRDIEP